jgi:SH3-like domain-containing protein
MNTQIRLSQALSLSLCLLLCCALVLLNTSPIHAKPASAPKEAINTKAKEDTKEIKPVKESAETVSVLKDGTNVRTGPSKDDQVAMELFQGYPLKVEEKKGDWIKVSDFEKDGGWIHKALVTPGNTVIVNSQNVINMRSEPKTTGAIVANIERGVVLTKLSAQGDWIKVKHAKGMEGWIHKTLLWP